MLKSTCHEQVLELQLDRAPVNALNPALIGALKEAFITAAATGARAIVLSGRPGLFSAGLDVPSLLQLDRSEMHAFWRDFKSLLAAIGRSPLPTVAAITGHSPAGGAVLSLFCDYRIMAKGSFRIGLNEVQVGLSVPEAIQFAMRRLIGAHRAERLMVSGSMLESEQALAQGLVDELSEPESVVARAHQWCQQLLTLPFEAMSETRRIARAELHAHLDAAEQDDGELFLQRWFSNECQQTLKALVDKLKNK
jgi:3,2-trans-enoyl-CoA isomerase